MGVSAVARETLDGMRIPASEVCNFSQDLGTAILQIGDRISTRRVTSTN